MSDSNNSLSTDSSRDSNGDGVLTSVQQQINSITAGASATRFQQNVTALASEKITDVKEAVVDNIIPAAGEALQSAQESIYTLAGKVTTGNDLQGEKETDSPHPDHQLIDQMDKEQICDFLRDKHRSTAPPLSKN
ncbi:uncharacterized protein N7473_007934 [Penicillium subrubescens]|uniref:uncharacterized protein n=1 Tax=Penicillium subrubescens TaxID=1316194 RepID=UPI00254513BE|nr:uncharacterized protein N7473_007934 [Penicillium subrubescens]KAJ5891706.1 hypothetical protein N7473_007934 [Penicillium subrubescens]